MRERTASETAEPGGKLPGIKLAVRLAEAVDTLPFDNSLRTPSLQVVENTPEVIRKMVLENI